MMTAEERNKALGLTDQLLHFLLKRYDNNIPLMSDQLYAMMSIEFDRLPAEQQSPYMDEFDKICGAVKQVVDAIATINPAHKRVALIHNLIDTNETIIGARGEASCRKGCSNCCHLNVDVTADEARVLRHRLPEDKELKKRLRKQSKVTDRYNFHYILPRADSACVFLKDHQCSVYDVRPMVCRMFYVNSPAEHCNWEKYPHTQTQQFVDLKLEVLKTMVFQRFGCDQLSLQLLK